MYRYIFLVLAASVFLWGINQARGTSSKYTQGEEKELLTIAHRGASGYAPENTFASFDKAIRMKAGYIEFDIQRSRDGKLVVIHDPSVDRTTNGRGPVSGKSLKELQELDAGSWFSEEFSNEKIPSFEELLNRYAGKVNLLIELKNPAVYPGIEEETADMLKKYHLDRQPKDAVILQSFDKRSIKTFHKIMPSVSTGVLVKFRPLGIPGWQLKEIARYADFVNPNKGLMNEQLVKQIHRLGMKTIPYTANDRETVSYLQSIGVDGMISNYPDYILELSNKRNEK